MQTQSAIRTIEPNLRKVANRLEVMGWMSFGLQLALTLAAGGFLAFTISHTDLSEATTPGVSIGMFWAICGTIVLLGGIYLAFRLARLAPLLRQSNVKKHPSKSDITKLLRMAMVVGLVGMALLIVGEGTMIGVLLAKAIAQPKPGAIYDVRDLVRPLDLMAALPHILGIVGHYVPVLISFSTLRWLQQVKGLPNK
ncbi:MAG TPA: DUF3611 family protein [Crinalium sp.]|jgi:hypothetical protein